MRNAENGERIVEENRKQTNLEVEIIDGQKEAEIIYSTHVAEEQLDGRAYFYIEVGGGSTELSLFDKGRNVFSRSFPVGTVRMLHDLVDNADWKEMRHWIKDHINTGAPVVGIATGGNINAIFKMLGRSEGKPLSYKKLSRTRKYLESFTLDGRIKELGLRPDRADVIIPATRIYLSTMKWAGIDKIIVPKIGLADGIIRMLYENYRSGSGSIRSKSA
jgi:exopolyphosphatase/guanosine-5'-triphosphate,3'-diphosphate pyrophosphatase